jgi:hypothetical protein
MRLYCHRRQSRYLKEFLMSVTAEGSSDHRSGRICNPQLGQRGMHTPITLDALRSISYRHPPSSDGKSTYHGLCQYYTTSSINKIFPANIAADTCLNDCGCAASSGQLHPISPVFSVTMSCLNGRGSSSLQQAQTTKTTTPRALNGARRGLSTGLWHPRTVFADEPTPCSHCIRSAPNAPSTRIAPHRRLNQKNRRSS